MKVINPIAASLRRLGKLGGILGFLFLAGMAAYGRTFYVSPSGSDSNPGTLSAPLATPARALARAAAGDSVVLRGGVYDLDHFLWIDKAGIEMSSYPRETAAIKVPIDGGSSVVSAIVVAAPGVKLSRLDIQGGSYYGVKVEASGSGPILGVTISRCRIHDTGRDCIKTFDADQLLIEDCDIGPSGAGDPSNAEGIDSIGSVGAIVRHCHIHDTATNGLYFKGGARDSLVEDCFIENIRGYGGILLGQDTDQEFMRDGTIYEAINCVARNNIIVGTGAAGLATYSGRNIKFENNTLVQVAQDLQAAIWVVTNSRGVPSDNVSILNNVIVMTGIRPFVFIQNIGGPLNCDWNLYFNPSSIYKFVGESSGLGPVGQWNLAAWRRVIGADFHSLTENPRLDAARLYRPLPGSPIVGKGERLPDVGNDYAGASRVRADSVDLGAWQHAQDQDNGAAAGAHGAK